jgi:type I restriction enzyme R subunit
MTIDFREDPLEQETIKKILKDLDYNSSENRFSETFPNQDREHMSEILLKSRLLTSLKKLNNLDEDILKKAIFKLNEDKSAMSLTRANQEIYKLFKNGIKIKTKQNGKDVTDIVKVFDFDNPENNDFHVVTQFWMRGEIYKKRTDLVVFVNGIPLALIELKSSHKNLKDAYTQNVQPYIQTVPQFFWYNAFIIISNGSESKIGTITSSYKFFKNWKKINSEGEKGIISLDTILKGTCSKKHLIDLFENFLIYKEEKGDLIKIVAQNHQFLGVNNAVENFKKRKELDGKLGVFWHTPGSGKSFSMAFYSQKILRKFEGNYTFLVLTDRDDLDEQIHNTFQDVAIAQENEIRATNGKHLKKLLKENHRFVFTLIHKFHTKKGELYPEITKRDDIIVMVDEGHRTQYDKLALNMKTALPNASFLAFTGTPLINKEEELTKGTFGDYVSVYNFVQSIEDGATVPVYYENRIPELELTEKEINNKIYSAIDDVNADADQEEKLKKEFAREYHLITREDRLDKVSSDIVEHYMTRGYQGKAMVVSIDKITAVKMYEKTKIAFSKYLIKLKSKLKENPESEQIKQDIELLEKLDMAVMISKAQDEVQKFKDEGLDILPLRKRMDNEDLTTLFKDENSNFKIVFLCNMWLTGFDVPTLNTLYIDKPMKNHTLMQTMARINRVAENKPCGLIVDYIGIFANLQKALSIYALSVDGKNDYPIKPKEVLMEILEEKLMELKEFCSNLKIQSKITLMVKEKDQFKQISLRDEIASKILEVEKDKNKFLDFCNRISSIYKSLLPDTKATKYVEQISTYNAIKQKILEGKGHIDIDEFKSSIKAILDKSIISKEFDKEKSEAFDISKMDFDKLKEDFEKGMKGISLDKLKEAIEERLAKMLQMNSTRFDFEEKFRILIHSYNNGSKNIEEVFDELVKFVNSIQEEGQRHTKENLTEEELVLFDKLKTGGLTEKDKKEVKKTARDLLAKLKAPGILSLDWKKKPQQVSKVRLTISEVLATELPEKPYPRDLFSKKAEDIFQHVFENYFGEGKSIYA